MKKRVALFIAVLILLTNLTACAKTTTYEAAAYEERGAYETVGNKTVMFLQIGNPVMVRNGIVCEIDEGRGTVPVVLDGRTLVPIRAIVEAMGGTVAWNPDTKSVTLNCRGNKIVLIINSKTAYLNDTATALDTTPKILGGRTMLPIRFVAESFDFEVAWDEARSVITIADCPIASLGEMPTDWLNVSEDDLSDSLSGTLRIHFIDVGQGDATFIELPNRETMLIDAAASTGLTAPYITALGYDTVDYVVATHPDADHIGGMPEVLYTFDVGTFYMPEKEHTTRKFEEMLDAIAANGCDAQYAFAGKTIVEEPDLTVCFVGPTKIYGDNNACSAVVKLTYHDISALFTGDAVFASESDMIAAGYDLSADILKVGHHGSATSTSAAFLAAVSPDDAFISVGKGNRYGHPTEETLQRLRDAHVRIHRTDESGTIIVESDGKQYTVR